MQKPIRIPTVYVQSGREKVHGGYASAITKQNEQNKTQSTITRAEANHCT